MSKNNDEKVKLWSGSISNGILYNTWNISYCRHTNLGNARYCMFPAVSM